MVRIEAMHLALAVRDEDRSRRFYETYFGFGASPADRMSDGVLMLYDADGFALALKETVEPIELPTFFHFAFKGAASPDEVRAFRDRLAEAGIAIVEEWEEPDYVSVKCRDPDGYVVEFAWDAE
ncbi:MAG TPA: VOC family protein [Gaiellaceae bacterium]|nr:VOC family protein [Gaiellaceae bacterium]